MAGQPPRVLEDRVVFVSGAAGAIGSATAATLAAAGAQLVLCDIVGPAAAAVGSERNTRVVEDVPSQRMGRADDVAQAILWLLSDASDFVVGQELVVDGGALAETFASPRLAAALRNPAYTSHAQDGLK